MVSGPDYNRVRDGCLRGDQLAYRIAMYAMQRRLDIFKDTPTAQSRLQCRTGVIGYRCTHFHTSHRLPAVNTSLSVCSAKQPKNVPNHHTVAEADSYVDFSYGNLWGCGEGRYTPGSPTSMSRSLYVFNIPNFLPLERIEELFAKYGTVANIKPLPMKRPDQPQALFVDFDSLQAAEAFFNNPPEVDGHRLRCDFQSRPRAQPNPGLHVGNLDANINEAELRQRFAQFGTLVDFRVCRKDQHAFAFVTYPTTEEASRAREQLNCTRPTQASTLDMDISYFAQDRRRGPGPAPARGPPRDPAHMPPRGPPHDARRFSPARGGFGPPSAGPPRSRSRERFDDRPAYGRPGAPAFSRGPAPPRMDERPWPAQRYPSHDTPPRGEARPDFHPGHRPDTYRGPGADPSIRSDYHPESTRYLPPSQQPDLRSQNPPPRRPLSPPPTSFRANDPSPAWQESRAPRDLASRSGPPPQSYGPGPSHPRSLDRPPLGPSGDLRDHPRRFSPERRLPPPGRFSPDRRPPLPQRYLDHPIAGSLPDPLPKRARLTEAPPPRSERPHLNVERDRVPIRRRSLAYQPEKEARPGMLDGLTMDEVPAPTPTPTSTLNAPAAADPSPVLASVSTAASDRTSAAPAADSTTSGPVPAAATITSANQSVEQPRSRTPPPNQPEPARAQPQPKSLYIVNLPRTMAGPELEELLARESQAYGPVESVRVKLSRQKVFAFVNFTTPESAARALEGLPRITIQGEHPQVSFQTHQTVDVNKLAVTRADIAEFLPPGAWEGRLSSTLFVGNVHRDTTEATLRDIFSKVAPVEEVVLHASKSGPDATRSAPYAFVRYAFICEAAAARKFLMGAFIDGNAVHINPGKPIESRFVWMHKLRGTPLPQDVHEVLQAERIRVLRIFALDDVGGLGVALELETPRDGVLLRDRLFGQPVEHRSFRSPRIMLDYLDEQHIHYLEANRVPVCRFGALERTPLEPSIDRRLGDAARSADNPHAKQAEQRLEARQQRFAQASDALPVPGREEPRHEAIASAGERQPESAHVAPANTVTPMAIPTQPTRGNSPPQPLSGGNSPRPPTSAPKAHVPSVVWQGQLQIKSHVARVRAVHIWGPQDLAGMLPGAPEPTLLIKLRKRLESVEQLVSRCSESPTPPPLLITALELVQESPEQVDNLQRYFTQYLQDKNVAGLIPMPKATVFVLPAAEPTLRAARSVASAHPALADGLKNKLLMVVDGTPPDDA
ncbi:uncharacterized protein MONBRDRAFT_39392 [Monosiga brevicollis MX1]|uniref:Uncharacterized protein n=1 Tax=Monosiga brevicollis TaxID=81824 RepID=A9VEH9_MONBE|nr:uncharacterized protein MONBRDRAFT_39392 [Monosiga brevicollis MX1]EDQ84062.1 predicted protein [Monosiga brevicollis MX1]|eukprot:XP_001751125.1 hypothetical protein [Monosiga brevicollis MX1]